MLLEAASFEVVSNQTIKRLFGVDGGAITSGRAAT